MNFSLPDHLEIIRARHTFDKYGFRIDLTDPNAWRTYHVIREFEQRTADRSLMLLGAILCWLFFQMKENGWPFNWLRELLLLVASPTLAAIITSLLGIGLMAWLFIYGMRWGSRKIEPITDADAEAAATAASKNPNLSTWN